MLLDVMQQSATHSFNFSMYQPVVQSYCTALHTGKGQHLYMHELYGHDHMTYDHMIDMHLTYRSRPQRSVVPVQLHACGGSVNELPTVLCGVCTWVPPFIDDTDREQSRAAEQVMIVVHSDSYVARSSCNAGLFGKSFRT